jgi:hypothetical protein
MHLDLSGLAALVVALTGFSTAAGKGIAYLAARSEARKAKAAELLSGKDLEINTLKTALSTKATDCDTAMAERDKLKAQMERMTKAQRRPR